VRKIAAVAMAVVLFGGVAHARFPDIKSLLRTAPASTSTSNVSDEKAAAGLAERRLRTLTPKTGTYPISSQAERRSAIREMGYVPI